LIQKLKQQGIPVVTVFLTGRPLWVNKELNAADAFVVAWLPGSEGQGVADVLLADSQGKPRYDFHGKLSFSWPRYDYQFVLNNGDANYDPLFAYGYGLTYADQTDLGTLSEQVSPATAASSDVGIQPLFLRNLAAGMGWVLADSSTAKSSDIAAFITTPYGISADGQSLAMQSVNLSYQEDGRQLRWNTAAPATASLRYLKAVAAATLNQAKALRFSLRFDQQVPANLSLSALCDLEGRCQRQLSLAEPLSSMQPGVWHTMEVALQCAGQPAIDTRISDALILSASGQHSLAVADIVLVTKQNAQKTSTQKAMQLGCAEVSAL
jgi:beta-glucosidase